MKTRICMLVLAWMLAWNMQAQSYDVLWKNVERMEQKDLPKSVIAEAGRIYAKAKAERDVPQMMKAYLTMMAWRGSISPDSVGVDIRGLEAWAAEPDMAVQDRAVLHSILGGVLIRNDFEKADRYLHLSLEDSLALVDYPAEKLVPMVETGATSRLYFDNNLYDLLARRAIRLWEENQWNARQEAVRKTIQDTYQSLLSIYKVKEMRSAWLLTALDAYPQADEKQLREWMKEYADLDVCPEVYLRLVNRYPRLSEAERLSLLREGIARYPRYDRINALKNEERVILNAWLHLVLGKVCPEEPIPVEVSHCNLSGLSFKLYRISLPVGSASLTKVSPQTIGKYGTLLRQSHFNLPPTPDCQVRKDTVMLEGLEAGVYYALATPDGHRASQKGVLLYVTGLQAIHRTLSDEKLEVVVLDKQSGHPVPGAQICVYQHQGDGYALTDTRVANAEGVVMLTKGKERYINFRAQTDADKAMPVAHVWLGNHRYQMADKTEEYVSLFTDRGIYRPGQTVHYSGIAFSQWKDDVRADEGTIHSVILKDADGREVAKQEVKTDAFGSFSGAFELPKMGKMGAWCLQAGKGTVGFRVEEYKRPTFEVVFDTVRISYRTGDSILVTGEARTFAGAPVQGAKVKYQVLRLENTFWRMRGIETNRVTGEAVTDAEGRFEVPVHFLPIAEALRSWYYTYKVSADVTNLAGETQEGTLNLPLGCSSLRLFIPDWEGATVIKEQPKPLTFRVSNLMDVPMQAEVEYQVLSKDKPVLQGEAVSNEAFLLKGLEALPSGQYRLKAVVKDEQGKEVEQTVSFRLFSLNDKRLPEGTGVWCYQPSEYFGADGTATLYFGSSEKDVYLFFDVMDGNHRMERKHIVFSDSLMAFRYTYRQEYGDGLRCSFAYLKNGELFVEDLTIKKPKPDKALQLKWKTFRDKLQPGAKETWTLSILRPDGKPADARLLATMYDASLDRLMPHDWHFGIGFARRIPNLLWRDVATPRPYWGFAFPVKKLNVSPLAYSSLDIPFSSSTALSGLRMYKASNAMIEMKYAPAETDAVFEEEIVPVAEAMMADASVEESASGITGNLHLRTDFAETAFFYPNLRTDAHGEVSIEFTLPESLTEWKFMGLAHTRDMDYGVITDQAVASKDFMLQPHLPRFVRVGDGVNIAASLINLSDKEVKGVVRMELFVPETEKVVEKQKRSFAVKAGETGTVSFAFGVTDKYESLAVRMVADGGTFSDGEQRYLPVLSNKQKLTESILLNANGKGTFTNSLEALFNRHSKTVTRPQMWVEYTGNPVWYAVGALKVVSDPDIDNALSWASAYYANALLAHLAKAEPRIADSLKADGLEARLAEAELKMKDLQLADGSWSWYKGMSGSLYMTTAITRLLARLQQMTGTPLQGEAVQMYRNAADFLYKQVEAEVQRIDEVLKQNVTSILPSETTLQYLYMHALDKTLPMQQRTQLKLMTLMTERPDAFTIYGKALAAIVFQEAGKRTEAREFLESLMQYSVMTEEMGRYFDTSKAEYSWFSYKIPTQVAAIEATKRITNEEKTQDEMKQWLIKQKQGQKWDNPIATTDAVYALIFSGKDWLSEVGAGEFSIRGGEIIISEGEKNNREGESLGYISQKVPGDVMKFRQVTVERKSVGIGWGAVYAEFEEDMGKVAAQGNALKVARTLYKDGKPLAEGEALQVGDKLTVRLTVVADRDMDFVQVKDERAACFEPVDALSGYRWNGQTGYYQETKDASTSFYLDRMRKGAHELTYEVYVTSSGVYQQGIATVRSVYAPEFGGHGSSSTIVIRSGME